MDQVQTQQQIERDRGAYAAPALAKGLDILELLAAEGEPMSTRAIAERLGRSKNEIFRMVFTLVERGYLAREPSSELLSLTNRLFELGIRTPRARSLLKVAVPAMERLSAACGHSAHLVVLNRGETVVIASASAGVDVSFSLRLGYRRPALDAASGRIIMAFQPPDVRARLVEEALAVAGRSIDRRSLETELEAIRVAGHHLSESHDVVGITDIGCPLLGPAGTAIASIVVPYLNRHGALARHDEVRHHLSQICLEVSEALV
jgi:DNA-binding IclR family transcriptional regulator